MSNPKLLLNISRTGEIKVVLTGSEESSRIKLLQGFEKYIEPKLHEIQGHFKLRLVIPQ